METSTTTDTYTVIVYGAGFYGCGNTYDEACTNASKHIGWNGKRFNPRKDRHRVFTMTKPVHSVRGSYMGLQYSWVDEIGESTFIDINDTSEKES